MVNFEYIQNAFKGIWSAFEDTDFYKTTSAILTIPNSRFVFVLFVLYASFTISQAFTKSWSRSMSPIQINILFGLSLLIFLQIAFRFIKGFTLYENPFVTLMISVVTILLALIFAIGKNLDEPIQITTVTTSIVFLFTYYVSRYYNLIYAIIESKKNAGGVSQVSQPITDSLLKAILFSAATGTFVLGITREYTKPDTSFNPDLHNTKYARLKKDSNGDTVPNKYVVPVFIYRWKDPKKKGDGAVRYPGEVTEYDKMGGPKGKKRKGVKVEYIGSNGQPTNLFISWMKLKEKGNSILMHRGKKADGTDDTGKCDTHEPIQKMI